MPQRANTENPTDFDPVAESVALILEPLSIKRDELKSELDELKAERREAVKKFEKRESVLRRHIDRLNGILLQADGKGKPKATKSKAATARLTPPTEVLVRVWEAIAAAPDGAIQSVLRPQLQISTDRMRTSVSWLRENEFIRLAKRDGLAKIYKTMEGVTRDDIIAKAD